MTTARRSHWLVATIALVAMIVAAHSLSAATVSEGVQAMNADEWQAMGIVGGGVKVGIVAWGFHGADYLMGSDLPDAASVVVRGFGGTDAYGSGDGAAHAEVVFDLAPSLDTMYLATVATSSDAVEAIRWMQEEGVRVISFAAGFIGDSPGDGTGALADAVTAFTNAGGFLAAATGDFAANHWQGEWVDGNGDDLLDFAPGVAVNRFTEGYGGSPVRLEEGAVIEATLYWNQWQRPTTDLDLVLYSWALEGGLLTEAAASRNPQGGAPEHRPVENLHFTVTEAGYYGLAVQAMTGSPDVAIELFAGPYMPEYFEWNGSLVSPADPAASVAVAAVDAVSPFPLQATSSRGPANGVGGSFIGGLMKPDLAAYDDVSTTSRGPRSSPSSFVGTSAACAHAAGAAAMVWSAYPEWTSSELRDFLESSAIDMAPEGQDVKTGHGRLFLGTPPAGCFFGVTPGSASFSAAGGPGSISVNTATNCAWEAATATPWISVTTGAAGTGPGTVGFQVAANTGDARTGALTVAGATHTVRQAPGNCVISLGTTEVSFESDGGAGLVEVLAAEGCEWSAASNSDWIRLASEAEGTGNGEVWINVGTYAEAGTRQGTLSIAGNTFTVTQTGICGADSRPNAAFTISPEHAVVGVTVLFMDSSGSAKSASSDVGFVVDPVSPEIGELVELTITGIEGVTLAQWDLGDDRCSGYPSVYACTPLYTDCMRYGHKFAGSGTKTVSLTVVDSAGATLGPFFQSVEVQNTGSCGTDGFGADPTEWAWSVSLDGETVVESDQRGFTHIFIEPGLYEVELTAANCLGADTARRSFQVDAEPYRTPDAFVVPAAVRAPGLNGTMWKTDLRVFNPAAESMAVNVTYLPESTNNADGSMVGADFELPPKATRVFSDILDGLPGAGIESSKGSLRIDFREALGNAADTALAIMSRTYNDTLEGTFGQFVPAVPVQPVWDVELHLTGLVENAAFRTNIGLSNMEPDDVWVLVAVLDEVGREVGRMGKWVPGYSTEQIVQVALAVGATGDLDIFSVRIATGGADLSAYASVVDNVTGDPVLYTPYRVGYEPVHLPGIAHLAGLNDSRWRSDTSFFNPTSDELEVQVAYTPAEDVPDRPYFAFSGMGAGDIYHFTDVLAYMMSQDSKGAFTVSGTDGSAVPQIAARTYNLAAEGGTFGQNLKVYGVDDLIPEGEAGAIPGVVGSAVETAGSRTNLGLLNISQDQRTEVAVTVYSDSGEAVAEMQSLTLEPGQLQQFNLFHELGMDGVDFSGSAEIRVLSNGPLAAYASVVDNRTQDPVLVPAVLIR